MHRLVDLDLLDHLDNSVDPEIAVIVKKMISAYKHALELAKLPNIEDIVIVKAIDKYDKVSWQFNTKYNDNINRSELCDYMSNPGNYKNVTFYTIDTLYRAIVSTTPQGLMKTMRVTTNALQLKSIINQRATHKLKEWRMFVKWAKTLYFWRWFGMYDDILSDNDKTEIERYDRLIHMFLTGNTSITEDLRQELSNVKLDGCDYSGTTVMDYLKVIGNTYQPLEEELSALFPARDYANGVYSHMCNAINEMIIFTLIHKPTKKLPKLDVEPGITLFTDKSGNTKRECNRMWLSEDRSKCHTGHIKLDLLDD